MRKADKLTTILCRCHEIWEPQLPGTLWVTPWVGSSVGIATDYGLDDPGSNPSGDEIFRPSRPAMGLTQPPVKWVPDLSRE